MEQQIRFCAASDGVRLAFASHGRGPPIVKAPNWLTHLEFDWKSPLWRPWLDALGETNRVIRYDERGTGLSDWEVEDFSLDAWVSDLEAVVDAAGVEQFALLGLSQGAQIAIAYAARHPKRVNHLVVCGGHLGGHELTAREREEGAVLDSLIKIGWGQANPVFRHVFTTLLVPGATPEVMDWIDELQRVSTSPENALRFSEAFGRVDVTGLAARVQAPTIVFHAREDQMIPFVEGRRLATAVPNARFVPLDSRNHVFLTEEPAWQMFVAELRGFLGIPTDRASGALAALTGRELQILELVADGLSNEEIANRLYLSTRTVERHLSNVYRKLGLSGKAARAAVAAQVSQLSGTP
ncbi:MAG: helix-turn-helix transcriptional regulator [Candidatus Rokuibacteriota bacterium]|nr:MAG: helix-turn-helix transcriptional regulator [Candidatus Rokubacteria bacterium]